MRSSTRWLYTGWWLVIAGFAVLHAVHLRADFPNHSPWWMDWAKYTDEGWYGNAAVRAHLFGSWYKAGDFNPAPAVPVWPLLEWVLFCFTGVTVEAARGLAVAFFIANLGLSYLLLRARGPRWVAMLALTMLVTSPFLYCFSRLAILEPMLTALMLAALNVAVRLAGMRRPVLASVAIGLLFTLMMLTKTTAVFLLPALGWAMAVQLWQSRRRLQAAGKGEILDETSKKHTAGAEAHTDSIGVLPGINPRPTACPSFSVACLARCMSAAALAFGLSFAAWMVGVMRAGLLPDYKYLFFVNQYPRPENFYWPLISLWWSFHGGLWVDRILIPLAGLIFLGAVLGAALAWRTAGARRLLLDPVFGASVLAVAGYILFMTYQDHPQPRYFAVVVFFCFFLVAQGAGALLDERNPGERETRAPESGRRSLLRRFEPRWLGFAVLWLTGLAVGVNGAATLDYATHPEYTFVDAAERIKRYIDAHPNGNRLLLSVSGDEITLMTGLPTINDLFVSPSTGMNTDMPDLAAKLAYYQPGWYAGWNVLDEGTLEDIHSRYSVEQVASFHAFDDPHRNVLVLFKLHPWPGGRVYDPADENLRVRFPEDSFTVPLK
jgi:hypothetical protein